MINGDNMKTVVFMGTPDFAVPALKALADSPDYDVKLVISQPDKPQGRKQILTPSPVKQFVLYMLFRQLSRKNLLILQKSFHNLLKTVGGALPLPFSFT